MKKYFTAFAIFVTVASVPFSASAEQPHQSSITFQQPYAAGDSTFDFAASKLDGIEAIEVARFNEAQVRSQRATLNRRLQSLTRQLRNSCRRPFSSACNNSTIRREITRIEDRINQLTRSLQRNLSNQSTR